jgi:hypothetical protein
MSSVSTFTDRTTVSLQPWFEVLEMVTLYVPLLAYMCVGLVVVDVLPSPNFQSVEVILPEVMVLVLVNDMLSPKHESACVNEDTGFGQ